MVKGILSKLSTTRHFWGMAGAGSQRVLTELEGGLLVRGLCRPLRRSGDQSQWPVAFQPDPRGPASMMLTTQPNAIWGLLLTLPRHPSPHAGSSENSFQASEHPGSHTPCEIGKERMLNSMGVFTPLCLWSIGKPIAPRPALRTPCFANGTLPQKFRLHPPRSLPN